MQMTQKGQAKTIQNSIYILDNLDIVDIADFANIADIVDIADMAVSKEIRLDLDLFHQTLNNKHTSSRYKAGVETVHFDFT